ncbi:MULTISPECIES: hypothetical protein [unclassified Pseudarthrobacter]|uniref:hypothetical protein n=1 Tax=unclassified Pseudarthrobacter TaxID=2647000 RepID=UPI0036417DCC
MVRWRDPKSRSNQGLTVSTLIEAETLTRLLDANGQSFEIAQHAILANEKRTPTVADVIQEHIDLLIRPSSGTDVLMPQTTAKVLDAMSNPPVCLGVHR